MIKKFTMLLFWLSLSIYGFGQVQIGSDLDGAGLDNWFGFSVAISADGTRMIAGAPRHTGIADESGHVRVYERQNGEWVQLGNDIEGVEGMNLEVPFRYRRMVAKY